MKPDISLRHLRFVVFLNKLIMLT